MIMLLLLFIGVIIMITMRNIFAVLLVVISMIGERKGE